MHKWSIKTQILSIVALMVAMTIIICATGIYAMIGIRSSVDEINTAAMRLVDMSEVYNGMNDVIIGVREVVLTPDMAKKMDDRRDLLEKSGQIDRKMKEIEGVTRLQDDWHELEAEWQKHKGIVNKILELSLAGRDEEAREVLANECNPTRKRETEILSHIIDGQKNFFHQATADAASRYNRALTALLLVTGIGIILSLGLSWLTVSRLSKRLSDVVEELTDSSFELEQVSSEISGAANSLAEASSQQASNIQSTSSTLEEMSSMTKQTADNTDRTSQSTEETMNLIAAGGREVENVRQAMANISRSSEEISQIIKTIEGIAFQTNLLALNAAVEAARAGEAGQGFAVVADEVRNLAIRSAQAAKDTTELISTTVQQVGEGANNVERLGESFKQIENGANEVGTLIREITSATNEQALGVSQVNGVVLEMDKVTQSNAAMAEETASSSMALSQQTGRLKNLVDQLNAVIRGGATVEIEPPDHTPSPEPFRHPGQQPLLSRG